VYAGISVTAIVSYTEKSENGSKGWVTGAVSDDAFSVYVGLNETMISENYNIGCYHKTS